MLSPKKIQYAGKTNFSFSGFNLLCDLAFDGDSGETASGLNRELIYSESYNGHIRRVSGSKYNETFAPKITLIKDDYSDLTLAEQRLILSWLTSKKSASFLDVYDDPDSNVIVYSLLGLPTEISTYKLANNRTVGITFTFESVAPWAFSPIRTVEKTITTSQTITLDCQSDDLESLVYPKITVTETGRYVNVSTGDTSFNNIFTNHYVNGTIFKYQNQYYWKKDGQPYSAQNTDTSGITTTGVYLYNVTTDANPTAIGNNGTNEVITIDGANQVISSGSSQRTVFGDNFSWNWLGLKPGDNQIKVYGNCTIKFEWREPRKVGELV